MMSEIARMLLRIQLFVKSQVPTHTMQGGARMKTKTGIGPK